MTKKRKGHNGHRNDGMHHCWSFQEARDFVRRLRLPDRSAYERWCKGLYSNLPLKPFEIPLHPQKIYKSVGWNGFDDFLGINFVSQAPLRLALFTPNREVVDALSQYVTKRFKIPCIEHHAWKIGSDVDLSGYDLVFIDEGTCEKEILREIIENYRSSSSSTLLIIICHSIPPIYENDPFHLDSKVPHIGVSGIETELPHILLPFLKEKHGGRIATPLDLLGPQIDRVAEYLFKLMKESQNSIDSIMEALDKSILRTSLKYTQGNKKEASRRLGITYRSMRYRTEKVEKEPEKKNISPFKKVG